MNMEEKRHAHPIYIMAREPRPSDRETRMYPAPGKWIVRFNNKEESR